MYFKPQNIRYFEAKQILLNESDFKTMRVPLINLKITLITDCMHSDLAISYLITIVYATLKSREILKKITLIYKNINIFQI